MTPTVLEVVGVPAAQGSKVRMPNGAMLDGTSKRAREGLAEWRRAIADACRAHLAEHPAAPLNEPLKLTVAFRFTPTKSDPHRCRHVVAPDLDKLLRAVGDALVHGGLLADDRVIADIAASKRYADGQPPGATITIESTAEFEASFREAHKTSARLARRTA